MQKVEAAAECHRFGQRARHGEAPGHARDVVFVALDRGRDGVPALFHVNGPKVPQAMEPAKGKIDFVQVHRIASYVSTMRAALPVALLPARW